MHEALTVNRGLQVYR